MPGPSRIFTFPERASIAQTRPNCSISAGFQAALCPGPAGNAVIPSTCGPRGPSLHFMPGTPSRGTPPSSMSPPPTQRRTFSSNVIWSNIFPTFDSMDAAEVSCPAGSGGPSTVPDNLKIRSVG